MCLPTVRCVIKPALPGVLIKNDVTSVSLFRWYSELFFALLLVGRNLDSEAGRSGEVI